MPQQALTSVENAFTKGLLTEFSGLNFPEKACTETYDCVFNIDGTVSRRLGFNFEPNYTTKEIDRTNLSMSTYVWKNVAGNGNINLFVTQIGDVLYFWDTSSSSVSAGAITSSIALSSYKTSGSPAFSTRECQFSSSTQYLVVTHPYMEPVRITYDASTSTLSASQIDVKIRDFEGDTADANAIDTRPTSTLAALDVHHKYNLYNQGWTATNLTAWDTARADMPSNVDVMWTFKNTSNAFDTAQVANVIKGNSPAPKGHFILSAWNLDRDSVSGFTGTTSSNSGYYRPTTSAFYAGRIFYSGVNSPGFGTNIYFSQILERSDQYGLCHQADDPTSEDLFDLLPSDGGVIRIEEAGTIYKLVSIPGALLIFANNGIWTITGSTGLGFTANDYTVQKISSVSSISSCSFVDVGGLPAWWNIDGIYGIDMSGGSPSAKNLTQATIKSFFATIPSTSKANARGHYNPVDGLVQWIYRSTESADITEQYSFDSLLNFNILTGAFYPWRVSTSDVAINGIFISNSVSQNFTELSVIDDSSDIVVDDTGDTVTSYSFDISTAISYTFKFLVSYPSSGSYKITFAENNSTNYTDWFSYDDVGVDYTSYLISGYKIRGQGLMKTNPVWVNIFSRTTQDVEYTFQTLWDYANTSATGRWSSANTISHTDNNYDTTIRRLRVRGRGKALQFKISSVSSIPFNIIGWATFEDANTIP